VLLVGTPAWSRNVRERVLTEAFGRELAERMDELPVRLGLRVLIIRRPGGNAVPERPRCSSAAAGRAGVGWSGSVGSHPELAQLDPAGNRRRRRWVRRTVDGPLFLSLRARPQCACCRDSGRPVARRSSAERFPERHLAVHHFGGDRWAGNLLVAPHDHVTDSWCPPRDPGAVAALRGEVELDNRAAGSASIRSPRWRRSPVRERTGVRAWRGGRRAPWTPTATKASVQVDAGGTPYLWWCGAVPMGCTPFALLREANRLRFERADLRRRGCA